jgi:hypothetical protein
VRPDSTTGRYYQQVLWHSASLYNAMLSSWVNQPAKALAVLPAEMIGMPLPAKRKSSPTDPQILT